MSVTMKGNQQHPHKPRGQSLVEFAILAPLLLVLVVSAVEFGRLFYTQLVITNAAREGAYYYAADPSKLRDDTQLRLLATSAARAEAENSGIPNIEVNYNIVSSPYASVAVTVSTTVADLYVLGFAGNFLNITANRGDFPLNSTVEMRIQWQ